MSTPFTRAAGREQLLRANSVARDPNHLTVLLHHSQPAALAARQSTLTRESPIGASPPAGLIGRLGGDHNFRARGVQRMDCARLPPRRWIPIIRRVLRRVHVSVPLAPGEVQLSDRDAHHVRNVLRLTEGAELELFDSAGTTAHGRIISCTPDRVVARIDSLAPALAAPELVIASAVPKGERADWMVEKLTELGVTRFIPLATERSVVLPQGTSKVQRWQRLATEAAKQSRRAGVMQIEPLTQLRNALAGIAASPVGTAGGRALVLSTAGDAVPVLRAMSSIGPADPVALFIGPEGGWSARETGWFAEHNLTGVKLTATILRIETAAVAAAAVATIRRTGD